MENTTCTTAASFVRDSFAENPIKSLAANCAIGALDNISDIGDITDIKFANPISGLAAAIMEVSPPHRMATYG